MSVTLTLTKRIQLTPEMIKISGLPPQSKYVGVEVATFNNEYDVNDIVAFTSSIGDSNSGFLNQDDIRDIISSIEESQADGEFSRYKVNAEMLRLKKILEDNIGQELYFDIF